MKKVEDKDFLQDMKWENLIQRNSHVLDRLVIQAKKEIKDGRYETLVVHK